MSHVRIWGNSTLPHFSQRIFCSSTDQAMHLSAFVLLDKLFVVFVVVVGPVSVQYRTDKLELSDHMTGGVCGMPPRLVVLLTNPPVVISSRKIDEPAWYSKDGMDLVSAW